MHLKTNGVVKTVPLLDKVAAVSCGLWKGSPILDLDYSEDSTAQTDANFVITETGGIVEIQGTAEVKPFSRSEFDSLLDLANQGIEKLITIQTATLGL